jgi:hypothetical protein
MQVSVRLGCKIKNIQSGIPVPISVRWELGKGGEDRQARFRGIRTDFLHKPGNGNLRASFRIHTAM